MSIAENIVMQSKNCYYSAFDNADKLCMAEFHDHLEQASIFIFADKSAVIFSEYGCNVFE